MVWSTAPSTSPTAERKDGTADMPTLIQIDERPPPRAADPTPAIPALVTAPDPPGQRPSAFRRALPLVAMAGGLVVMAVAALVMVRAGDDPAPAGDPLAITLSARDVSVVTQVYEPGHDSGWHSHPGIHAVAVVSGVLTVVDAQCQVQIVEPGRPYVGGQELHVVRNHSDQPVTMSVTYLSPTAPGASTKHMPGPLGCG